MTARALRFRLVTAFAAVYVIWGSTYLAIRFAIETLPPFGMAGARFILAGAVLFWIARARGAAMPHRLHWRSATVVGALMLLGGNGGVVWAEQRVPSGLAALLIATVPLWMALLEWMRREAPRPSGRTAFGLACGMAGVAWLASAGGTATGQRIDPLGAVVLVAASLSWALGSLHARRAALPASPVLATALEMMMGGACLLAAGFLRGEFHDFAIATVSGKSLLALLYLFVLGSLIAFTAYVWLLHHTSPTRAATYAFVNPLVAVVLGWALAGESLSPITMLAAMVIIAGVVLIVTARRPAGTAARGSHAKGAPGVLPGPAGAVPAPVTARLPGR
jgi:drug/metabolite transporter (DMT)-like permease